MTNTLADRLLALYDEQCALQDSYGHDPAGKAARLAHGHASAAEAYKLAAMMVAGEERIASPGGGEVMRAQQVEIARLRARVIVNADDVTAAGITVEHIKAWLTARGWARDGGVNRIGDAPWESWRTTALIERRREVAEAMRSSRGRLRMQPPDGPRICLYVAPTDQQLADHVQEIAKMFGVVALDLLDELAESAKAERRSDPT